MIWILSKTINWKNNMKTGWAYRKFLFMTILSIWGGVAGFAQEQQIYREDTEWSNFWMPHTNDTELPHILLIGNSIVMRYSGEVEKQLKDMAYCARFSTSKSLGDPGYLAEIELVLQHKKFDVIHFNNGLHGFDYTEQEYIRDYPKLHTLLKKYAPEAKLIWATTTPVRDNEELDKIAPRNRQVIERNRLVAEYLQGKDVQINDLYALLIDRADYFNKGDGIHPNQAGTKILADQVSKVLKEALGTRNK